MAAQRLSAKPDFASSSAVPMQIASYWANCLWKFSLAAVHVGGIGRHLHQSWGLWLGNEQLLELGLRPDVELHGFVEAVVEGDALADDVVALAGKLIHDGAGSWHAQGGAGLDLVYGVVIGIRGPVPVDEIGGVGEAARVLPGLDDGDSGSGRSTCRGGGLRRVGRGFLDVFVIVFVTVFLFVRVRLVGDGRLLFGGRGRNRGIVRFSWALVLGQEFESGSYLLLELLGGFGDLDVGREILCERLCGA